MSATVVEPRYLTYQQAEAYCSCSRWTLYRAVKRGELIPCRGAGPVRFDRRELDRLMKGEQAPRT